MAGIVAEQLDLSPEQITRIVGFLGYGRLSAPVWFIGIEEGLGGMNPQEASKNLKARAKFGKTMDLHEAHKRLLEGGRPIDIENKPPSTQVWRYMAKIMLAYNGNKEWKNRESVEEYVRFKLGRYNGQTFLTELSPIPARGTADRQWMTRFKDKDPDLDRKMEERKKDLRTAMKEHCRSKIICHGLRRTGTRNRDFAKLLEVEWREITLQIYESKNDATCLLLPFFGSGQMSHQVIRDLLDKGLLGPS
jgi:hypothetical protein